MSATQKVVVVLKGHRFSRAEMHAKLAGLYRLRGKLDLCTNLYVL
jgi:hypothetical protein